MEVKSFYNLTGFFSESQLILRWLRVNAMCKGEQRESYKNVICGWELRLELSREVKGYYRGLVLQEVGICCTSRRALCLLLESVQNIAKCCCVTSAEAALQPDFSLWFGVHARLHGLM